MRAHALRHTPFLTRLMRQERAPFALAAGAGSLPLVRGAAAAAAVGAAEHRGPGAFKPRKRPVVRVGAPAPGFGPGTTAVQLPEASQTVIAAGGRPLFDRWGRSCCSRWCGVRYTQALPARAQPFPHAI